MTVGLCYYSGVRTQVSMWCRAAAAAGTVLLAGCSGSQDEPARAAATDFLGSVAARDGAAACELLAPAAREELAATAGKTCSRAILDEDLTTDEGRTEVHVFDTMAQVSRGDQMVFLSTYDGRWLVVAAACTPVADRPYDCRIGLP